MDPRSLSRFRLRFALSAALLCVATLGAPVGADRVSLAMSEPVFGELAVPEDEMSAATRADLQAATAANIARLEAAGRPVRAKFGGDVLFRTPIKLTDGHPDRDTYLISNYVDEDPGFPDQLQDWNCGTRTYDLPSGYNHRGTDFATWPFAWRKMAQGETVAVAAASGTIVNKQDGNFDQSCALNGNPANFIFVRHDDGSVAWYLHLKSGSLTAKGIGDPVAVGEYLGIVGSSGSSTAPHLHFELYDSGNQLVDPFAGACNRRGTPSRWLQQEPYYVSRINHLATSDAPPEFPACPGVEVPHFQQYFVEGQVVYAVGYFRDLKRGGVPVWNIYQPDGSVFFTGAIDTTTRLTRDVDGSAFFYYTVTLPAGAPAGEWTFEIVYLGASYRTPFYVGAAEPPRVTAVEYYAPSLDHYFITAFPEEQAALDRGVPVAGWQRTGVAFPAYAGPGARSLPPACRFFGTPGLGVNSHFYTVIPAECSVVKLNPGWTFEANAFNLASPAVGLCPDGTRPLYRMYNNGMRASPNHRYVTDLAQASGMTAAGWLLEGTAMCLPQ
ncbi:MAG: peptidoglycan DD-metalloendopeptidase family protein [Betaproteobacteria bacterium]